MFSDGRCLFVDCEVDFIGDIAVLYWCDDLVADGPALSTDQAKRLAVVVADDCAVLLFCTYWMCKFHGLLASFLYIIIYPEVYKVKKNLLKKYTNI